MPVQIAVSVRVQFSQETIYGTYTDAIYYDPTAYETMTSEQVQADIAARVAAWVEAVANPPAVETADTGEGA